MLRRKPRDSGLAFLLREFLFIVVTKKFHPVVRKIESKRNEIADFLSRRFDEAGAKDIFKKFVPLIIFDFLHPEGGGN